MNIKYLPEYVAWVIRNTYKESGLKGSEVDCDKFVLMVNLSSFDYQELPDKLLGWDVMEAPLQSDVEIALGVKPEDCYNRDVRKFLKAFYEVQSWSDFHYGITWKEECKIEERYV